jgi:EAL domain-containing protein (putative c-di-GMP-specific phosphodiesterase class I)
MAPAMIPTFREVEDAVGEVLRKHGGLGGILLDLSPLARIERRFGGAIYRSLRAQIEPVVEELRAQFREGDLLVRDERDGDRFFVFLMLGDRRKPDRPLEIEDLRKLAGRLEDTLTPRIARLVLPYGRERTPLPVGYGMVLYTPLESAERQILRLIEETRQAAAMRLAQRERREREELAEVVFNWEQTLWVAFQPIVEMESRQIMAHEALGRGPRGTPFQSPLALFGRAERYGMVEELERAFRRQAFREWSAYGAPGRLFVNTVPSTVRDESFLGRGVLEYLGPTLSPRDVTLELTEREAIENLSLYRDGMHAFLEMGFSFAIDDLGAGYSGLETVATLGASYLKIDMGLVRDLHQRHINQQIVKAIVEMGVGVGATIIAEGIETAEEAKAVADLGVRYAQGYYFARPIDPRASPKAGAAKR